MDDLISRWEAINALERKKDKNAKGDVGGFYNRIIQNDIDALMQLPSAQPERKRGKWIPQNLNKSNGMISTAVYYYPKCSVCGANANFTNFCPNCGAEMMGD